MEKRTSKKPSYLDEYEAVHGESSNSSEEDDKPLSYNSQEYLPSDPTSSDEEILDENRKSKRNKKYHAQSTFYDEDWLEKEKFSDSPCSFQTVEQLQQIVGGPKEIHVGSINSYMDMIPFVFNSIFGELVEKIISDSNEYCSVNKVIFNNQKHIFKFEKQDILNWLAIWLVMGLTRYPMKDLYWSTKERTCNGIYGSQFIQETMGMKKWKHINRFIHCDIEYMGKWFHSKTSSCWTPSQKISIDDDLYLWTGRGGSKKKIDRKADGTGVLSWNATDSFGFTYLMFWDSEIKDVPSSDLKSEYILKKMDQYIPQGDYIFIIDAGILGRYSNALYLHGKNRKFVISCPANNPSKLFAKKLHKNIEKHETHTLYNDRMCALSYYAKKVKCQPKIINFLFNLGGLVDQIEHSTWDKACANTVTVMRPKVIPFYNYSHNSVDRVKSIVSRVRNPFRNRRPFRAMMHAMIYNMLHNTFLIVTKLTTCPSGFRFRAFIQILVQAIRSKKTIPKASPTHTLVYHKLETHKSLRRRCCMCGQVTSFYCSTCSSTPKQILFMCKELCNIRYHNPLVTISEFE